ncbi:hypothetical protein ZWY2020_036939 [Hordeum vulgare]|nr:hypothetical protein ZWY2020_036939 [Hordeum vulgare]
MAKPTPAADWSSLHSDLVSRVAGIFLGTSDIDYYISIRAVCRNWRAATDDQRGSDRRFRPRRWIFLGDNSSGSGHHLFLNVETGRFLWKDLTKLRYGYSYVTTTDGLLVLPQVASSRSGICLFNPFTGHRVLYPLNLSLRGMRSLFRSVTVAGSSPVMLYLWRDESAACLDPSRGFEWVTLFSAEPALESLDSVVAYQGRPYAADRRGAVAVVVEDQSGRLATVVAPHWGQRAPTFLVDCDGDLLLVRVPGIDGDGEVVEVCWINVEDEELWTRKCIGNYAIFLGDRCISVNADKFTGVQGNCIYYFGGGERPQLRGFCMHRLEDGRDEKLFDQEVDQLKVQACPLSLAQLLMPYADPMHFGRWIVDRTHNI